MPGLATWTGNRKDDGGDRPSIGGAQYPPLTMEPHGTYPLHNMDMNILNYEHRQLTARDIMAHRILENFFQPRKAKPRQFLLKLENGSNYDSIKMKDRASGLDLDLLSRQLTTTSAYFDLDTRTDMDKRINFGSRLVIHIPNSVTAAGPESDEEFFEDDHGENAAGPRLVEPTVGDLVVDLVQRHMLEAWDQGSKLWFQCFADLYSRNSRTVPFRAGSGQSSRKVKHRTAMSRAQIEHLRNFQGHARTHQRFKLFEGGLANAGIKVEDGWQREEEYGAPEPPERYRRNGHGVEPQDMCRRRYLVRSHRPKEADKPDPPEDEADAGRAAVGARRTPAGGPAAAAAVPVGAGTGGGGHGHNAHAGHNHGEDDSDDEAVGGGRGRGRRRFGEHSAYDDDDWSESGHGSKRPEARLIEPYSFPKRTASLPAPGSWTTAILDYDYCEHEPQHTLDLHYERLKLSELSHRLRRRSLSRGHIMDMFRVYPDRLYGEGKYRDEFVQFETLEATLDDPEMAKKLAANESVSGGVLASAARYKARKKAQKEKNERNPLRRRRRRRNPVDEHNKPPPFPQFACQNCSILSHTTEECDVTCGHCGNQAHDAPNCDVPRKYRCKCAPFPLRHVAARCLVPCSRRCAPNPSNLPTAERRVERRESQGAGGVPQPAVKSIFGTPKPPKHQSKTVGSGETTVVGSTSTTAPSSPKPSCDISHGNANANTTTSKARRAAVGQAFPHRCAMLCRVRCCMCGLRDGHCGRDCWLTRCRCGGRHLTQDCPRTWKIECPSRGCPRYLCGVHCRGCGTERPGRGQKLDAKAKAKEQMAAEEEARRKKKGVWVPGGKWKGKGLQRVQKAAKVMEEQDRGGDEDKPTGKSMADGWRCDKCAANSVVGHGAKEPAPAGITEPIKRLSVVQLDCMAAKTTQTPNGKAVATSSEIDVPKQQPPVPQSVAGTLPSDTAASETQTRADDKNAEDRQAGDKQPGNRNDRTGGRNGWWMTVM